MRRFLDPTVCVRPRWLLPAVGGLAAAIAVLSLGAKSLWVTPEARGYVVLAAGIAERWDFSHDLFLLRTPGYPLLLASIFACFGSISPWAILVVQHLMMIASVVLLTATAWRLTRGRVASLLAGALLASNLQLWAYAGMVMSEVPYTLVVIACAHSAVRAVQESSGRALAVASLLAGVAYLVRPLGLGLVAVTALAGLLIALQWRKTIVPENDAPKWKRRFPIALGVLSLVAVLPAGALAGGWVLVLAQRSDSLGSLSGPALFRRTVTADRLDSASSPALMEIQSVVSEARARGLIEADADGRDGGTVVEAYRLLDRGGPSHVYGRVKAAALDLIREHPRLFLMNTLRYSAWSVLRPDSSYRFLPGGAPGVPGEGRSWRRNPNGELLDSFTYTPMMKHYLDSYSKYLPLTQWAGPTLFIWRSAVLSYLTLERPVFLGRSAYEWLMMICGIGAVFAILGPRWKLWLIVYSVVLIHVVGASLLVGPVPRYAVPVQPFILAGFGAFLGCVPERLGLFRGRRRPSPENPPPVGPRRTPAAYGRGGGEGPHAGLAGGGAGGIRARADRPC